MENKKKRIVIALGGNALGNTLPEQMKAVKITAKAIVDLIEEGCEVIVAHGNGPQVGMINNAMAALSREDAKQPNTPLSVCVAMSQAYIGYDLQNALREELYNREMYDIPVATMITQVRVDADDPAFEAPSKPIGHFMTEEQAKIAEEKYGYIMKEDSGRGYRRVVASPKPAEIVEIGAIRSLVDSGQLVIACGGGGIPVTRQGNHLKGASAVIDKDFASELLAEESRKKSGWMTWTQKKQDSLSKRDILPPVPCFPKFRLLLNLLNQNQDALPSLRCWKKQKTVSREKPVLISI